MVTSAFPASDPLQREQLDNFARNISDGRLRLREGDPDAAARFAAFIASQQQQPAPSRPDIGSFFGSGLLENVARGATGIGRRFSETVGQNPFLSPSNIQQSNAALQQQTRETLPNPPQSLLDLNQKVLESGADVAIGGGVVRGGSQLARAIGVSAPATGAGRIPQAFGSAAEAATSPAVRRAVDRVSPVGTARAFSEEAAGGGGRTFRSIFRNQVTSELGLGTDARANQLFDKPIEQLTRDELREVAIWGDSLVFSQSPRIQSDGDRLVNAVFGELDRRGLDRVGTGPNIRIVSKQATEAADEAARNIRTETRVERGGQETVTRTGPAQPVGSADEAGEAAGRSADEALEAQIAARRSGGQASLTPEQQLEAEVAGRRFVPEQPGAAVRGPDFTANDAVESEISRARAAIPQMAPDALEAEVQAARQSLRQRQAATGINTTPVPTNQREAAEIALATEVDVRRLTNMVKNFKPVADDVIEAQAKERRARFGRGLSMAEGVPSTQAGRAVRSQLGGELPSAQRFEAVRGEFTEDSLGRLYDMIWRQNRVRGASKFNADRGLGKLLGGEVPQPNELKHLEDVFGGELVDAITDLTRTRGRRIWELFMEGLGLPRVLMSAYDISATLRQGGVLTVSHPRKALWGRDSAFARQIRALGSEKFAMQRQNEIKNSEFYTLLTGSDRKVPLFFHDLDTRTSITRREEQFISKWAAKIPGIRASERGFATYLNELKFRQAEKLIRDLQAQGINPTSRAASEAIDRYNAFLNAATGRGRLPGPIERHKLTREILTTAMWSPRLFTSRIEAPAQAFRALTNINAADPAIRLASRQIAGDFAKYVGGLMSILAIMDLSGWAEVEMDPRSSDFAKIRIGRLRLDPWAGFQQVARYGAQWLTGQRKTTTTGKVVPTGRADVLGRLIRSKMAPGGVSLTATMLPEDFLLAGMTGGGENFIGEEVFGPRDARPLLQALGIEETPGALDEILDNLITLIVQDIEEGMEEEGLTGGLISAGANAVGVGTTAFPEPGEAR